MLALVALLHALPTPQAISRASCVTFRASQGRGDQHASLRGQRLEGRCKWFDAGKGYGFLSSEALDCDVFVHASKILPNNPAILLPEDLVSFSLMYDYGRDKLFAEEVELLGVRQVFKCFSMSQPFASLLMKNYKTIESRNSDIFMQSRGYFALHVGRKPWRNSKYRDIMERQGLTASQISDLCRLPGHFAPGDVVGIVEVGETWQATYEERGKPDIEAAVVAAREDMGKYLTPILRTHWLKQPLAVPGKPGIWNISIPRQLLPTELE
eukprot:767376-Hanusia_phi.AAC.3